MEEASKRKFLDPLALSKIAALELRARMVVEGYYSGLHKSPYQGFSVEFAEHREYVPGEDIRHIDWRVYAKSDRYYIKQYEEDTNLRCYLLLDTSASMEFTSTGISKLEYGSNLVAALTYLMLHQQDAVGLLTFDDQIKKYIPPRSNLRHFKVIIEELENTRFTPKTDLAKTFHDFAEKIKRRGLIIIISDLFDDPKRILVSLQHFKHKKHEVIVFHLLDEEELAFPFQRLMMFEDLESKKRILTNPRSFRRLYHQKMKSFLNTLKQGCYGHNIDYVQVRTSQPYDEALTAYLARRAKR